MTISSQQMRAIAIDNLGNHQMVRPLLVSYPAIIFRLAVYFT